jgi:hypothetical protein
MVNQIRLSARAAVPTALFALEVQREGIPGAPRGTVKSVKHHVLLLERFRVKPAPDLIRGRIPVCVKKTRQNKKPGARFSSAPSQLMNAGIF